MSKYPNISGHFEEFLNVKVVSVQVFSMTKYPNIGESFEEFLNDKVVSVRIFDMAKYLNTDGSFEEFLNVKVINVQVFDGMVEYGDMKSKEHLSVHSSRMSKYLLQNILQCPKDFVRDILNV